MLDPQHLRALNAVLETGSFDLAAARLMLTPSAISQRIKALEDHIGAIVVQRGQPCTPTDVGAKLARHYQDLHLLESKVMSDIGAPTALTSVRIAVNADSLATWLLPALAETEGLLFDIVIDDQDHSARWLRSGEVAGAITSREDPVQGCNCTPLGRLDYLATASPAFVARYFKDGLTAQSLSQAPALTFDAKDALQRTWAESIVGKRVALQTHHLASSQGFVDACVLGLGWGMNPVPLVAEHIKAGRLVALSDQPFGPPLHWQVSRLLADALTPLTKAIGKRAASFLTTP